MKLTMKKTLAILVALVQLFTMLSIFQSQVKAVNAQTTAEETHTPELNPIISGTVQFGSFNYISAKDTYEAADYVMPFVYTDDYFAAPSYSSAVTSAVTSRGRTLDWTDLEDKSLATASLDFAMACFGSNEENTSESDYQSDYDKNGLQYLRDCQFTAVTSNNMGGDNVYNQLPHQDSVGVIFGVKEITVWNAKTKQNETSKLVAIGVRGAGYGAEWASNLTMGESGVHQGFRDGADKVKDALNAFLTEQGITAQESKFWVVGYSRAGAIANLVAGDLDTKYNVPKEQVYAYTFEAAAGASMIESGSEPVDAASDTTNYPNIHNIINEMDAVPRVSTSLFSNNRLGVDYRVPFYNNTTGTQNSDYYNRMYSILPTIAQGYYDADGVWGDDAAVINAKPNTAGGTYPVDGLLKVHKFDILAAVTDGENYPMGAKPYDDWKGTLIPNATGTKNNYYIHIDDYLSQLVYEAFHSRAWDYNGSLLSGKWEAAGTKWTYAYKDNPIINTASTTDAGRHRENYVKLGNYNMKHNYDVQNADEVQGWSSMTYQNAFRYLVGKVLGRPGVRLTDVVGSLTDNLWDLITEGGGFYLSITGVGGYDSGTNENRASIVDSHMRALLMDFLDDNEIFKDPNYIYRYRVCGDTKFSVFDDEEDEYDTFTISQDTAEAIGALSPVLTRLFLYDRTTYGSQYLGTLLKYGLDTILVTHTPELAVSWQKAMDENYTSDFREITIPKATNITMNVFRAGFEGEMDADVQKAASADGAVIATVTDGNMTDCKDNRITVRLDPTDSSNIIIRYPGTMDYRIDVKPLGTTTDLNINLKDLAPVSGTNVKATYERDSSTGNIEGVPAREYDTMLVQDGTTNTVDATDINAYSDSNVIAMQPSQTLHILAWHGSNSLDTDANKEAEYAIQITTPTTKLVDFNTVTVAENADLGRIYNESNGQFNAIDGSVVYQLNTTKDGTATTYGAFGDVDTANADYYADTTKKRTQQIYLTDCVSIVPSSSVYYDDALTTAVTSDGHGYSSDIDDNIVSKNASTVSGSLYFTFYGNGIDVYCTTDSESGYVSAGVFKGAGIEACVKANRVGNGITVKNASVDGTRYNTPTISFRDLGEKGTYTLKINANEGAKYKLDGVRVYQSVQEGSAAASALAKTDEANVIYLNLRQLLLNAEQGFSVQSVAGMDDAFDKDTISGILFVDNAANLASKSHYYKGEGDTEETWHEQAQTIYATQFDAYKANSPKNEIYLSAKTIDEDENEITQAITFQVNLEKAPAGKTIYLGMSAPETGSGKVNVTGMGNIDVTSVMDMYYSITVPEDGSITIRNVGSSLISLTNLKIPNVKEIGKIQSMPETEKKTALRSFFQPVTTETVELAAQLEKTVDPEEPELPKESPVVSPIPVQSPEPTANLTPSPEPSSTTSFHNRLTNLVRSFFRSLSRLFGR